MKAFYGYAYEHIERGKKIGESFTIYGSVRDKYVTSTLLLSVYEWNCMRKSTKVGSTEAETFVETQHQR